LPQPRNHPPGITAQRRDADQRELTIDFAMHPRLRDHSRAWLIGTVVGAAALGGLLIRTLA
jgi:hypothetical protein